MDVHSLPVELVGIMQEETQLVDLVVVVELMDILVVVVVVVDIVEEALKV
jgi:hypothetical protein